MSGATRDEILALVNELMEAQNARDWVRMRALLADDFLFTDHRPTSFGANEGPDGWIHILQVAIELVADRTIDLIEPVPGGPSGLMHMKASGTDEFESPVEWDFLGCWGVRDGLLTHLDVFALEDVEPARRRAEEIATGA